MELSSTSSSHFGASTQLHNLNFWYIEIESTEKSKKEFEK